MFEYFLSGYGLATQNDPKTENCNLFYAEYLTLKKRDQYFESHFKLMEKSRFMTNMAQKLNERGVYNRRSGNDKRSVSHDEITGWMVSSKILNTSHGWDIWSHLTGNFGSYNNTGKLFDYVPFNPANYYAWGQLVESKASYIFLPFYMINLLIASNKPKENTSSKIIYWLELSNMPKTAVNIWLNNYYESKMKSQYGNNWLRSMLEIYFNTEDRENFPIFKELKQWDG